MATATTATTATATELAQQVLDHRAPPYTFTFSPFLRTTYGHGLPPNRPPCKAYMAGHCPLGAQCPDRHVSQSGSSGGNTSYNSLVCKHWLRALCKKGESCEFLHEYNLRKMPECNFFVRNGYCSNGDECLYLHIDPRSKLPPCPHYDRGFCPLGPACSKKHVRRRLCPYYLAGFCPDGRACKEGAHPGWNKNLEKPTTAQTEKADEAASKREDPVVEAAEKDVRPEREGKPNKERFGGGRSGRWRNRSDKRFKGGRSHH